MLVAGLIVNEIANPVDLLGVDICALHTVY